MVTLPELLRADVVTIKLAELAPVGIVTLPGTVARFVLLLERLITRLAAVIPSRVTVPVEFVPRLTDVGFSVRDARDGTRMVKVADLVLPLDVADIETVL